MVHNLFSPWPALAPFGKTLELKTSPLKNVSLFYYDVPAGAFDGSPVAAVLPAAAIPPATVASPSGVSERGGPLLVLVHGLGDEADTWRRLIPPLSGAGCRVIAVDLPGFGRSGGRGNYRRHRDAVLEIIKHARHPGRCVVVGSSMGAVVAEAVAFAAGPADSPEHGPVNGLVLIDGCIPTGAPVPKPLAAMACAGKKWYRAFRGDHEGAWKSLFPYYADIASLPVEDRDFLRERVIDRVTSPLQERSYFSTLKSMLLVWRFMSRGMEKRAASWPGSISLIWGSEDRIVPKAQGEYFQTVRKDAELHVIPGAGHLPHQEQPEACAKIILGFLRNF
jgi:pimeloyl-ACP methyl ester carboxylesterase